MLECKLLVQAEHFDFEPSGGLALGPIHAKKLGSCSTALRPGEGADIPNSPDACGSQHVPKFLPSLLQ